MNVASTGEGESTLEQGLEGILYNDDKFDAKAGACYANVHMPTAHFFILFAVLNYEAFAFFGQSGGDADALWEIVI